MDLLRIVTAGSVDDGKSTLIGRLLYDTKSIFEDQLEAIERTSLQKGYGFVNLALLTDGLRAEREQGITIDVAYRYFSTPRRKFILADSPGHVQYTRNMVTGASTANLMLVLVDARHGVLEQTRRHALIASILHLKHVVLCVNKMDLVDYKADVFERIRDEFEGFAAKLGFPDVRCVPVSALTGENIVERSKKMPWYEGPTLMYTLENVHVGSDPNFIDCRFPVQTVIRPQTQEWHDFRGYAGRIESGIFKPGDEVLVLPNRIPTRIKAIYSAGRELEEAFPPQSVTMTLTDEVDISRGDMIVKPGNLPGVDQEIDAMVCWMSERPLATGGRYRFQHTTRDGLCSVREVKYKIDVATLHRKEGDSSIGMNDIGRISLKLSTPIFYDSFRENRAMGAGILIDEFTNETVAAVMLLR